MTLEDSLKFADLELGNILFNTNDNQIYECPRYVVALLEAIGSILCVKMWNKYQEEYSNPFENTGNKFKNDIFEVEAYSWNDDYEQPYNFKYKDIEISWYKYLGRDTTINKNVTPEEIVEMFNSCIDSLKDLDSEVLL